MGNKETLTRLDVVTDSVKEKVKRKYQFVRHTGVCMQGEQLKGR